MPNYAVGVNPIILQWAREKAGYSVGEVAELLKKKAEVIIEWESGDSHPTYNQLERLAYSLYKRPLAVFFFPEPPEEPDLQDSFRSLPEIEYESFLPDTRHAIREAQAMQLALYELTDGKNPSEQRIFSDLAFDPDIDVISSAQQVRDYLGVTIDEQRGRSTTTGALIKWREHVQACGIFVFKRSFKQEEISGFCLLDEQFPIIYLNNSTAKSRQLFSLFHEIAHILLGIGGVTKVDDRFVFALSGKNRAIEIFCNRFAAELLVPSHDFEERLNLNIPIDDLINDLSSEYNVSREVILRKLLDRGIITQSAYEERVSNWLDDYIDQKAKRSGGGNYYANQYTYLGDKFLSVAFSKFYDGSVSVQQLAEYLNVKTKNVPSLEEYFLSRISSE